MQSLLIKDTTRAQREEIVRRALSACGSGCDGCNGCGNSGGGRVDSIYQPYIDGEKELPTSTRNTPPDVSWCGNRKAAGTARRFFRTIFLYGTGR